MWLQRDEGHTHNSVTCLWMYELNIDVTAHGAEPDVTKWAIDFQEFSFLFTAVKFSDRSLCSILWMHFP